MLVQGAEVDRSFYSRDKGEQSEMYLRNMNGILGWDAPFDQYEYYYKERIKEVKNEQYFTLIHESELLRLLQAKMMRFCFKGFTVEQFGERYHPLVTRIVKHLLNLEGVQRDETMLGPSILYNDFRRMIHYVLHTPDPDSFDDV